MKDVSFRSGGVTLAGNLHFPQGFDGRGAYPALVCVHPGSSVKEQTAGIYARAMAEQGYVALAFDASCQGASGGEPRFTEEPAARVEDIRCAVDYLATLPFVDAERIGALGVCAGGGYAVHAAMTDRRIRAVGVVSVTNIGAGIRKSLGSPEGLAATLDAVGRQRTEEARGAEPLLVQWIPNTPEERVAAGLTGLDTTEAVDYYRTPRGAHPRSSNQLRFRSMASLIAFDAFHLVEDLLTQPLQIIVGTRAGEFDAPGFGRELFARARCAKDLHVVDGASHYDLYDVPRYVDEAVRKLTAFYAGTLRPAPA